MSLSDTAEHYQDVKAYFYRKKYIGKNNVTIKPKRKKGFKYGTIVWFGKHKDKTIKWIIENDLLYFNWLKTKILLDDEITEGK